MSQSYDLTQLDAHSFEHLINFLALKVLGNGVTGFAAGPDGGRDGFLIGKANYPTDAECWQGTWFIQSKFHKPHLSNDPQKWLYNEVKKEIKQYETGNRETRPENWIIATNIEPSGTDKTGAFDKINEIVKEFDPDIKFDIWGGRKVLDYLMSHKEVAETYGHFLTPGHVITELYSLLKRKNRDIESVVNHLIINQFVELNYTKLEQAGANGDHRPKIYQLFRDLPIVSLTDTGILKIMRCLVSASNNVQKNSVWRDYGDAWRQWSKSPSRSRILLVKGGPGQGKSTAGQYFSQIQRASFILSKNSNDVLPQALDFAQELKNEAMKNDFWPTIPRIPLFVELKDFAKWYISKSEYEPRNVVSFIIDKIKAKTGSNLTAEIMHDAFRLSSWFINFDGLDEVPNDVKDQVSNEIISFANELIPQLDADFLVLCTTRPQGYSGQFENLNASEVNLIPLPAEIALDCASALVTFDRDDNESEAAIAILKAAMQSEQVQELMTTPLQAHIMAVLVRDGGRPPEKRWELFNNFYNVMKRRESLKDFPDQKIQSLLREQEQLLKSIHDRLGISLHARAEISDGAESALNRSEFKDLAKQTVEMQIDYNTDNIVATLMEATIERLVFVNTPDDSQSVRFDVRQLQEFFAAEFIYTAVSNDELRSRVELICSDAHWREVVHFLLSALTYHQKMSELSVVVNILQYMDDDSHNNKIKSFRKNLGAGALMTLRLLSEGVLEQDRKIRQPFAKSLIPIWGMLEPDSFYRVISVKKEQSRNWLTNNMIDCMTDMDYSEHISAGYLLSLILSDDHPRLEDVKQRLNDAPEFYLTAIFSLFPDPDNYINFSNNKNGSLSPLYDCKPWFIEFAINLLFSIETKKTKLQRLIVNFVYSCKQVITKKIEKLNIPEDYVYLIGVMLSNDEDYKVSSNNSKNGYNPYCFLSIVPHKYSWYLKWNEELLRKHTFNITTFSPVINVLKSAVVFYSDVCLYNFKCLLKSLQMNDYNFNVIPPYLRAMIPLPFDVFNFDKKIDNLVLSDDFFLEEILRTKGNGRIEDISVFRSFEFEESTYDDLKWQCFCDKFPVISLRLSLSHHLNNPQIELIKNSNNNFYKPILKIILSYPEILTADLFSWNSLFKLFPEKEIEIRSLFLKSDIQKSGILFNAADNDIKFKFNLPEEKNFINNLARTLLTKVFLNSFSQPTHVNLCRGDYNVDFLSGFGLSEKYLVDIINNDEESNLLRASSLSCYMALPSSDKNNFVTEFFLQGLDTKLFEIIDQYTVGLLTDALYVFLFDVQYVDNELMELLGKFSIKIKSNYECRLVIQGIYQRWRERSLAPVSREKSLDDWLKYEYKLV